MIYLRFWGGIPSNANKRFYIIKIEKDLFYISIITKNNYLFLVKINYLAEDLITKYYKMDEIFEDNFHKLLFIKENILIRL